MIGIFTAAFTREFKSFTRNPGQVLIVPLFFIMASILFPLALEPYTDTLQIAGPGLIVIAALFASLLPLGRLFEEDLHDGTLENLIISQSPLGLYVFGKLSAYWLMTGFIVGVISSFPAMMFGLSPKTVIAAQQILPVATLLFTLIGSLGAAITLNAGKGSILLALLMMPFYIPVLIFSASAIDLVQYGITNTQPSQYLWAILALALPVTPLVNSAILRWQID